MKELRIVVTIDVEDDFPAHYRHELKERFTEIAEDYGTNIGFSSRVENA